MNFNNPSLNREDSRGNSDHLQQAQQPGAQANEKKGRRTKTDPNSRGYICGCGKSYLSYPALYTHIKQKHNGKIPPDTKKPQKSRGQRGRPTTTAPNNIQEGKENFEQDDDNLSSDSNDALNIVEELVLYLFSALGKDGSIILQENQSNTLSDISSLFQTNIFEDNSDFQIIQSKFEEAYNKEGQIDEDEEENSNQIIATKCNSIFGLFIYSVSKHLKDYALKELIFYCCLFRKALNEKGWQILQELGIGQFTLQDISQEFCEVNNAQHVLEISNEFITEILPSYLERYQNLTPEFNWLYARRYTNSMLERNDEGDF